jgi:peptidoglycan/LPS O-acetylase OafA/YrhL
MIMPRMKHFEPPQASASTRRTDLDWLRIAAFALLILFHIGMFYVPSDWVIKSPHLVPWLQYPMDWSSPWRLLLLFIVSGAATRFMSEKLNAQALLISRSARLLPPLLFATLFVVPFELYAQAVMRLHYGDGLLSFWRDYIGARSDFCTVGPCPFIPSWDYMWFVAYLWIYTALLAVLLIVAPSVRDRLERAGRHALAGSRLFLIPMAALIFGRLVLRHFWPETHDLLHDWYLHAIYALCFLFGYLFATDAAIWDRFTAQRHRMLAIAVVSYALYAAYNWYYAGVPQPPMTARLAMVSDYGIDQWAWVAAAFGYARRYLAGRDGPARRYLTEAIFPYYIVHQTVIVMVAYRLAPLHLPLITEAAILIAATVIGCALTYEIARRVTWLHPWFGLKWSLAQSKPVRRFAATTAPPWSPYPLRFRPAAFHPTAQSSRYSHRAG